MICICIFLSFYVARFEHPEANEMRTLFSQEMLRRGYLVRVVTYWLAGRETVRPRPACDAGAVSVKDCCVEVE